MTTTDLNATGKKYLFQLADLVPSTENVEAYSKIIREKYYIRSLINVSKSIIEDASSTTEQADLLLESAEQKIYDIRQGRVSKGPAKIGDIIVNEGSNEAIVFCDETIAPFLLSEWTKAGNDKIRISRYDLPPDFAPVRKTAQINDTVASPRLDAIVASLCALSREKAREIVVNECAEVEYQVISAPDRAVCAPCVISVRGYGKFRILSVSEQTKKGRYRLVAEKYL